MAKPNFSGVYTLKSSENEDAFLKAQGVSWVLRKAAKAVVIVEPRHLAGMHELRECTNARSGDGASAMGVNGRDWR